MYFTKCPPGISSTCLAPHSYYNTDGCIPYAVLYIPATILQLSTCTSQSLYSFHLTPQLHSFPLTTIRLFSGPLSLFLFCLYCQKLFDPPSRKVNSSLPSPWMETGSDDSFLINKMR